MAIVEVGVEQHIRFVVPLGSKTDDPGPLLDLLKREVLVEQPEEESEMRRGLNIKR